MPKLIRLASLICCAFVIASFFLFAVAQTSHASRDQTSALTAGPSPAGTPVPTRARPVAQPRKFIDQVATQLDAPFTGIVASDNTWIRQLIPTALALLVYGFCLSYLARWTAGRPA